MKTLINISTKYTVSFYILLLTFSLLANNTAYAEYTFQECSNIDKNELRSELSQLTQKLFSNETGYINVDYIVQSQWESSNIDRIIALVVDNAVNKIKNERGFLEKFWSGFSENKAKEFTIEVANNAFKSIKFERGINELTENITNQLSEQLNDISENSATTTLQCLKAFIGNEYASATKYAFEQEIQNYARNLNIDSSSNVEIDLIGQHEIGLVGIGILISKRIAQSVTKRITKRIANSIGKRVVGAVASKMIPYIGWAMIGWDLIENGDGALPVISQALKSEEIKNTFRQEISTSLSQELPQSSAEIANSISDEIFTLWIDFKKKFRNVLDISEKEPEFKEILNYTKDNEFYKLSKLVNIFRRSSQLNLMDSINNGDFEKVMALHEITFIILESTNSVEEITAWENIAGSNLTKVVEFEIYQKTSPEYYDKQRLNRLIAINDKPTISRLITLKNHQLDTMLLTIPEYNLIALAKVATDSNIALIPPYLTLLGAELNTLFINMLLNNHNSINYLNNGFEEILENNTNKSEIITYYLSPANGYESFFKDGFVAASTDIPLNLFFMKYKTLMIFIMAIMLLLVVWRFKPIKKPA